MIHAVNQKHDRIESPEAIGRALGVGVVEPTDLQSGDAEWGPLSKQLAAAPTQTGYPSSAEFAAVRE